jgi:hypothetical protein
MAALRTVVVVSLSAAAVAWSTVIVAHYLPRCVAR